MSCVKTWQAGVYQCPRHFHFGELTYAAFDNRGPIELIGIPVTLEISL